ncbi:hypothetical protein NQZ68_014006 [Dissostichus eleginoides]|nr:hypothetical protein NQZ68_014006 [Dissostichus eleginoides]
MWHKTGDFPWKQCKRGENGAVWGLADINSDKARQRRSQQQELSQALAKLLMHIRETHDTDDFMSSNKDSIHQKLERLVLKDRPDNFFHPSLCDRGQQPLHVHNARKAKTDAPFNPTPNHSGACAWAYTR